MSSHTVKHNDWYTFNAILTTRYRINPKIAISYLDRPYIIYLFKDTRIIVYILFVYT